MHDDNEIFKNIRKLVKNNDLLHALDLIDSELNSNPNDSRVLFELGKLYLKMRKFDEAKKTFIKISDKDKNDIYSLFELAKINVQEKNYDEAEKLFNRILDIKEDDLFSKFELGKLFVLNKKYNEAEIIFNELLHTKCHFHAKLELGKLYVLKGNNYLAKRTFKQILYNKPDDIYTKLELSKLYMKSGKFDKALKHLNQIIEIKPNDRVANTVLATIYSIIGRKKDAIKIYEKILLYYPNDNDAKLRLGAYYLENNELEKGKQMLLEIKNDKEYAEQVDIQLSHYYSKKGDIDYAKDLLNNKSDAKSKIRLVRLNLKENNLINVQKLLDELDENDIYVQIEKARFYFRLSKIDEAKEIFLSLLNTELSINSKNELAKLYMDIGELYKSYDLLKELYDTSNGQYGIYELATLYYYKGNYNKSLEILNNAKKNNNYNPYFDFLIAKVLVSLNDIDEAKKIFNKLLKTKIKDKALSELLFIDIHNEEYAEAYEKFNSMNLKFDNIDQVEIFLKYKLNLEIEDNKSYFYNQLHNYSKERLKEKMNSSYYNKEADKIKSKFIIDVIELYNSINIDKIDPVSRTLFDKYIIDFNYIIGEVNDNKTSKLSVITLPNSKNILLYYPISMEYCNSKEKQLINKGVLKC